MPESRPKRPQADGLSRACFDGDLASVQQCLGYARELGTHFGSYEHIGAGVWRDGSSAALIRGER